MSALGRVRSLVARLTPQGAVEGAGLKIAGILLAAALLGFILWWFLVRPRAAQVEAATARVERATAQGAAGAAQGTIQIVNDNARLVQAIDALSQENGRAIHAAAGASDTIGADLDRIGRTALCMRAAYQSDPGCAALRRDGGGIGPAAPDAGGDPPG